MDDGNLGGLFKKGENTGIVMQTTQLMKFTPAAANYVKQQQVSEQSRTLATWVSTSISVRWVSYRVTKNKYETTMMLLSRFGFENQESIKTSQLNYFLIVKFFYFPFLVSILSC